MPIKTVMFDADDTLWHHDNFFKDASRRFHDAVNEISDYPNAREIVDANRIKLWGYGVKGFILTMIETAITLTDGKITGTQLKKNL